MNKGAIGLIVVVVLFTTYTHIVSPDIELGHELRAEGESLLSRFSHPVEVAATMPPVPKPTPKPTAEDAVVRGEGFDESEDAEQDEKTREVYTLPAAPPGEFKDSTSLSEERANRRRAKRLNKAHAAAVEVPLAINGTLAPAINKPLFGEPHMAVVGDGDEPAPAAEGAGGGAGGEGEGATPRTRRPHRRSRPQQHPPSDIAGLIIAPRAAPTLAAKPPPKLSASQLAAQRIADGTAAREASLVKVEEGEEGEEGSGEGGDGEEETPLTAVEENWEEDSVPDSAIAAALKVEKRRKKEEREEEPEFMADVDQPTLRPRGCTGACVTESLKVANSKGVVGRVAKSRGLGESDEELGPEDGSPAQDEGNCKYDCGVHGYCRGGRCKCVVAYEGTDCSVPVTFPSVLNQEHVVYANGVTITTNPKAGVGYTKKGMGGQTHTLFAPLIEKDSQSINRKFNSSRGGIGEGARAVITPTLLKYLPSKDPLKGRVYKRCAIVGSSGLSMIYNEGPTIDAHDAVIRFNSAPTRPRNYKTARAVERDAEANFPLHVGTKTTFRFINTQHIFFYEGAELRIQQMQSKNGLFRYLTHIGHYPHAKLVAFDTDFTSYVSSNIPNLPTGGYFAVMFGLQMCTEVNLYGFHWRPGHAIPHHYFNSEVPLGGKVSIHDYAGEYNNILALAQAGHVNLVQPCVTGCEAESGIPCKHCAAGSTCACGENLPTPMALPGFCHMRRNYTCMYKCPSSFACLGGPSSSRCPKNFDPVKHGSHVCYTHEDAAKEPPATLPKWATLKAEGSKGAFRIEVRTGPERSETLSDAGAAEQAARMAEREEREEERKERLREREHEQHEKERSHRHVDKLAEIAKAAHLPIAAAHAGAGAAGVGAGAAGAGGHAHGHAHHAATHGEGVEGEGEAAAHHATHGHHAHAHGHHPVAAAAEGGEAK